MQRMLPNTKYFIMGKTCVVYLMNRTISFEPLDNINKDDENFINESKFVWSIIEKGNQTLPQLQQLLDEYNEAKTIE